MMKFDPIRQVYRLNKNDITGVMERRLSMIDFDEVNYIEEYQEFKEVGKCVWISMDSGITGIYEMDIKEAFELFRKAKDFRESTDYFFN